MSEQPLSKYMKLSAELIERAQAVAVARRLSEVSQAGDVGSALITEAGNIYTGASLDCACGIGFCAEHSAIAAMVTHGENRIAAIVAVTEDGRIIPPCGRCRELISQMHRANMTTRVVLGENEAVPLEDLLPRPWKRRT